MQFGQKQIELKLQVDENIPLHLFGDELRIKQVLNNLLSNAFKYTHSGEVNLSFASANTGADTTTLVICVRDTGEGMTQEQIQKLFEEYTRFNQEANRTTVGTGLGMAITRNLIQLMDGVMSVDSTPGEGSVFTVRIPQKINQPGIILGKEAAENLQNFRFHNIERDRRIVIQHEQMPYGKVLVVDDIKSNLDVARMLLAPYNIAVDTANSGFEAIAIIKSGQEYDVIFMDHMMPKMDGIEAVKNIRALGYTSPIVALTASAVTGQREIFMESGFNDFISKPIDTRQLHDSLKRFVRDKKLIVQEVLPPVKGRDNENAAVHIPGVESKMGLALYNGNKDIYINVLRAFVPNALALIEKMQDVTEKNLPDYAIDVHGLKGISAGIGAEKVKEAAYDLETAAKSGNVAEVVASNQALLDGTKELVSGIQAWLDELDNQSPMPLLAHPDPALLVRLRTCCEAYDMEGVDAAMDELESASYETGASLVMWLREKIDASDFSAAAARLLENENLAT
jgi:CheY-like chemotaxis protein/HPt (histidine-containing phosphotransfer) domain-containing protein/anti-sigma regulatory factor (Ser/Thr protein kinase)